MNSIVREWQAAGLRTSLGNEWSTKSLKVLLENPRLCGWRRLNGEIVRDDSGNPVVGQWTPIVTSQQWEAADAILRARKGRIVHPNGSIGDLLPTDFRQHLLTGILRCGKPRHDGSGICGAPLRIKHQRDCRVHLYSCVPRSKGGCAGTSRNGRKVDEYITEAVLAKLEERRMMAVRGAPWTGEEELRRLVSQRDTLAERWNAGDISDEFFFPQLRKIEDRVKALRTNALGTA